MLKWHQKHQSLGFWYGFIWNSCSREKYGNLFTGIYASIRRKNYDQFLRIWTIFWVTIFLTSACNQCFSFGMISVIKSTFFKHIKWRKNNDAWHMALYQFNFWYEIQILSPLLKFFVFESNYNIMWLKPSSMYNISRKSAKSWIN